MGRPPLDRKASNTVRRIVSFPKSDMRRIKTWASKRNVNVSEAIRRLVEIGMEKEKK